MPDRIAEPMKARGGLGNRLLAALPPEDLARLRPHLEPVPLPQGKVLFDAGRPLTHVYFIEAGVVALVSLLERGTAVEMATVGNEGMVGLAALLDGDTALARHVVQVPGAALAMELGRFRSALGQSRALRTVCAAYTQAVLGQALQAVACNAVHTVEQRCARWLLMADDRSRGDSFALTQELLAAMLGVHRSTVTDVAGALQGAGLIAYRRGIVTVLDRPGLEAAACECYWIVRDRYDRLLPSLFNLPLKPNTAS